MKVAIESPYLATLGGGERYVLTAAEFFLRRGDSVDIFSGGEINTEKVKERFGLDIFKAKILPRTFSSVNRLERLIITAQYDLFFFLSDGSIPLSFARKNILHFQTPFNFQNRRTIANKLKLSRFKATICNSCFTKNFIDQTYGVKSRVIYPPVDTSSFQPGEKENTILSVGRFFAPSHAKNQELLVTVFKQLLKKLKNWQLVLFGGLQNGREKDLDQLRELARELPIKIITNGGLKELRENYARAKIYWHAAGYGEDLKKHPEKAEHFGITTVEAMAAGAVPIVFAGGGQREIVENRKNGFFWGTVEQLKKKTLELAESETERKQISQEAINRSQEFSKERFFRELSKLLN